MKSLVKNKYIGLLCVLLGLIVTFQNPANIFSNAYIYSDSSVYQLVARTMYEGGTPYRDVFDHKGIFFYFINLLGYIVHPRHGIWIIEWVAMTVAIFLAYKIARTWLSKGISLLVVIFAFTCISGRGYWIGNTPESWSLLFLFLTEYLFIRYYYNGSISNRNIFTLGVCGASLLLMKPTMTAIFPIYIVYVLMETVKAKEYESVKRYIIFFVAGMLVVLLPSIAYLVLKGGWADFINDYVVFNFAYGGEQQSGKQLAVTFAFFIIFPAFVLSELALVFTPYLCELKKKDLQLLLLHLIAFGFILIMIVQPGRSFIQYSIIMYPVIVSILGIVISNYRGILLRASLLIIVGMIGLNGWMIRNNCKSFLNQGAYKAELVNYLQSNTPIDAEIAVATPDDAWIYLMADRESATSFPYTQADIVLNGVYPEMMELYFSELDHNKPQYIIANKDNDWFLQYVEPKISTKYGSETIIGRYSIYHIE